MSNPRFSIVIPTRNRHNTLKFALLTCLNQNFDDYEIIVCDNCSSPETRETVMSFESEKIKYIRSDRPLAMSHNWELAVSQAKGEFVTLIGDDDGLLLNALSKIDQLIKILGVKALHWEWVNYHWPDIPTGNWLNIPLVRKNRILKSSTVIPNVANCRMSVFDSLPMIYNSAIHRDLINQLKERTGRVFSALAPDVYSGFAFAYLAQSYACIGLPLGVAGKSSDSAGQATLWSKNNSNALEFSKLNAEANLGYCHHIPDIPVLPVFVADSFQRAKDNLFPYDKEININRKRFILNCITQLRERVFAGVESEEDLRMHLSTINASLSDDLVLQKWFNKKFNNTDIINDNIRWFDMLRKIHNKFLARPSKKGCFLERFEKGFNGKNLVLDASDFGLENVFDVAKFSEKFFNTKIDGLDWYGQGIQPDLRIQINSLCRIIGNKLNGSKS